MIGGTEADTDRQRHGIGDIVDGGPIKTDVDDEFVDLESRAQRRSQLQPVRLRDPPLGEAREVAAYTARVAVKRIKPNILSERFDESRAFYNDVIGLDGGEGLEWILFFGTDQPEVQLSVVKLDIKAHVHPDVSIEVDDVDAVYDRARAARAKIVYPLTDEEWGLRRFFVRDPNGAVINVTEHS